MNNIYFENYCKKIYNFIFTYINFIISLKLLGIIIIYYLLLLLKKYNNLMLIDDFILYLIHTLTIILLLSRLTYIYIIKKKINLSFYNIQNVTYDLFSTYVIGFKYSNTSDIDDIDDSYSQNLIIHNSEFPNLPVNGQKGNEIQEFKDILLFFISYFISIIFKVNNYENYNNFILNTQIYENYFAHKFINPYYNYNVNTYSFKLHILEYNIKLYLTKSYNNNILLPVEYKQCLYLLNKLNKQMRFIYLYLDINIENDTLFLGLYNQKNIIIKLINILNDILIFISIILTIIYYINYLTHTALIYIILLSFLYLYLNVIIYILFNNHINNQQNNINMPINLGKYGLDLQKLLISIYDEINILYCFSHDNNQIIFK